MESDVQLGDSSVLNNETRRRLVASDIAAETRRQCLSEGWPPEEADAWARSAEEAFGMPLTVDTLGIR